MMYSDDLVEVRKKHANLLKEARFLEEKQVDLWKKLIKEFNNNIAVYKKSTELSGIINARPYNDRNPGLFVVFGDKSYPSALALSRIEKDTGLQFKGNVYSETSDNNVYFFDLK